jgi:hypothetical protein
LQTAHDRRVAAYNTLLGLYRGAENRLAIMSADLQGMCSCDLPVGARERTHWV